MNACANQEATRADNQLAHIYKQLLVKAAAQPEALKKIKAAEKAWLEYRDTYLAATYPAADKQAEYGSIYPMETNLLRARLTRQHISDLKEMLRNYNEGK